MLTKILALFKNRELQDTVLVTAGSLIGSVFGYLLQLFLGRKLSIQEFGEFSVLLSLLTVSIVPISSFSTSLVKLTAQLKAMGRFDTLTQLFKKLALFLLLLGALCTLGIYLERDYLARFLNLSSSSYLPFFGIFFGLLFINTLPVSYLQGLSRFRAFAFISVLGSVARFAAPVFFIFLGFGLLGVFQGLIVGLIITFSISLFLLNKHFQKYEDENLMKHYSLLLKVGIYAALLSLSLAALNNLDLILVKHFFTSEESGLYASVVTVGKILLFGAGSVSVVMFPIISEALAKRENPSSKFKFFLLLQAAAVLAGLSLFYLFPGFITTLFFPKFSAASAFLPRYALFVSLYIFINLFAMYFLAINKTKVSLLLIVFCVLQFLLICLFHSSLNQVININILVSALIMISLIISYKFYACVDCSPCLQEAKDD